MVVTILSHPLKATKVSTVLPTCSGSHEVKLIVLVTSGSKVVTVVTKLSQPDALIKVSVVVPTCRGSHVVAVVPVLS